MNTSKLTLNQNMAKETILMTIKVEELKMLSFLKKKIIR